jgi:hypothetical protein
MITRSPFLKTRYVLKTRYGGYLHRDVPDEDAELTHVGPHTSCGEYLRRFWQRARPFGWCELLADDWPVDFAITANSPGRHSVSARKPTFPDQPAECFLSQRRLPLGLTQFF